MASGWSGPSWLRRETEIRFGLLLGLLVALLVVVPAVSDTSAGRCALLLVWWSLLISAAAAAGRNATMRRLALAIALVVVGVSMVRELRGGPLLNLVSGVLDLLLLGTVIALMLDHLLTRRMVTTQVVIGGICVYFLLATLFAQLYALVETLAPGSFSEGGAPFELDPVAHAAPFLYFSFVTITTLGYGDIAPGAPLARSLAAVEAFLGQIYLAIMVAYLVGVRVAQARRTEPDAD